MMLVSQNRKVLITSVNRPSVRIMRGQVSNWISGRKRALISPKISASQRIETRSLLKSIPGRIREKLRKASEKAARTGMDASVEFLREAKSRVAGVYVMPPFKKYDIVPVLLKEADIRIEP